MQYMGNQENPLKPAIHLEARRVLAERPFTCSCDESPIYKRANGTLP